MRIIGIDPGIEKLGFSIIDFDKTSIKLVSSGLIKTSKNDKKEDRMKIIYDDLTNLISNYKPEIMAIESLIFSKNTKTALLISEIRGIILLIAILNNIRILEFTPLQIKSMITGYGKADKKQIENALKIILNINEKQDDICDAIACGVCGTIFLNNIKLKEIV